ncbi:TolC family protein [Empedobacter brevis]|uniref:TolC family protein n=1 Tax=Empedobacter brevis TaxID=247 RepID=UPI002FE0ADBD
MKSYLIRFLKESKKNLRNRIKFLLIFLCLNTYGQVKLNDLISKAISANNVEENYQLNTEKSIYEAKINNNLLPSLSLDLSEQENLGRSFDQISGLMNPRDSWFNTSNLNLRLQYKASKLFFLKSNNTILEETLSLNKTLSLDRKQKIALEVIESFYNALLFKSLIDNSNNYKEYFALLKSNNKKLFDLNKIDKIDLLRSEKELINLDQEIALFSERYNDQIIKLEYLTLSNNLKGEILEESQGVEFNEIIYDNSINYLPEVELNNQLNKLDSLNFKKKVSERLFSMDIFSSLGTYYSSKMNSNYSFFNQLDLNTFFSIGVKLSIPIYNIEEKNQIKTLEIKNIITKNERILENTKSKKYYSNLVENYNNSLATFEKLETKREILNEIYELNKVKYNYDKITILNLLQSYIELRFVDEEWLNLKYTIAKNRFILNFVLNK